MDEQRQKILDQLSRQAAPFSEMHARDDAGIYRLLIETADIRGEDEVLDVAYGPGLVACEIAKVALHVTGVDLTRAMIEQAEARQRSLGLANLTWAVGDAQPLAFPITSVLAGSAARNSNLNPPPLPPAGAVPMVAASNPDVVCLQEIKAPDEKFPVDAIREAGYEAIWHGQKSYNGVAILTRVSPWNPPRPARRPRRYPQPLYRGRRGRRHRGLPVPAQRQPRPGTEIRLQAEMVRAAERPCRVPARKGTGGPGRRL